MRPHPSAHERRQHWCAESDCSQRLLFGGLRLGLLMAVGVILLVLATNFQSLRLSLAVGLTIPAVIARLERCQDCRQDDEGGAR